MSLDPEKIKALIAKKNAPKTRKSGGRKAKGNVDTSVRTIETWFALHHRFYDFETQEMIHCSNPDCQDPREGTKPDGTPNKGIMVVEVNNTFVCRYCFLGGYATESPAQETVEV